MTGFSRREDTFLTHLFALIGAWPDRWMVTKLTIAATCLLDFTSANWKL